MRIILLFSLFMLIVSETTYTLEYHKEFILEDVSNSDRYMRFEWSDFNIPAGENVIRMQIKLSTFMEEIGDFSGGFGTTTVGPDIWWKDMDTFYDFFWDPVGTVSWDVPKDISETIDFSSFFRIGIWWIGSNFFTLETITVITGEYAVEEEEEFIEYKKIKFMYNEQGAYLDTGGKCPDIKRVEGGLSGEGWLDRFYDCCKPMCSTELFYKASNHYSSRECDVISGIYFHDHTHRDLCTSGPATICPEQIPFMVKGCDIGFGFVSSGGRTPGCGKCYLLEFDGNGRYENTACSQALKGKKMLVISTNYNYDIDGSTFSLLVPGGTPGLVSGCDYIYEDLYLGNQFGGLIRDCEEEVGFDLPGAETRKRRKTCLVNRCNNTFNRFVEAKNGCLFLTNFLDNANLPTHKFYEVECPDFLKEMY